LLPDGSGGCGAALWGVAGDGGLGEVLGTGAGPLTWPAGGGRPTSGASTGGGRLGVGDAPGGALGAPPKSSGSTDVVRWSGSGGWGDATSGSFPTVPSAVSNRDGSLGVTAGSRPAARAAIRWR
jgi:hypothetical protein